MARLSGMRAGRLLLGCLFLASVSLSAAQGGAAGYGQQGGMGGGGFGGGGFGGAAGGFPGGPGGRQGNDESGQMRKPGPDDDNDPRVWTTKSAILTPGDRVEFKFDLKKGETIMASAVSDAFDPALSVTDPKGKEIAKNDDREEGNQSPFVIARATSDGIYLLKVLSYRSVAGGKFTAKFRTFMPVDTELGPKDLGPFEIRQDEESADRIVIRLPVKKGKIYDLRPMVGTKPYQMGLPLIQIVGPTAVSDQDYEMIPTGDGNPVILTKVDGDVYIEYRRNNLTNFRTDYREVAVLTAKPTDTQTFDLEPNELKVIEMPVKPDLIVHTKLDGGWLRQEVSGPPGPGNRYTGEGDGTYGTNLMWSWYRLNYDDPDDVVRVFHGDGTARIAVRSQNPQARKVTLTSSESLPLWESGKPIEERLNIGDVRLYLLKSTKSELMKVYAKSEQFQTKLDIFRLNGQLANSLMDRRNHVSQDDLYFPEAETYIVRLICDGYGGSGPFAMRRTTLVPSPYTLGAVETLKLDGTNFGLYSVNLEAGKRYQFLVDHPEQPLRVDLLDDEGEFLVSQSLNFGEVAVQYFTPKRSGRHRLWLRGSPGEWHFRLEPHVPPKVQ